MVGPHGAPTPPAAHTLEPKLASDLPAVPHAPRGATSAPLPAQSRGATSPAAPPPVRAAQDARLRTGLARLNAAAPGDAERMLLDCCASGRWARRLADHRPYRDLGTLLAAADEAAYDLRPTDLDEALAGECAQPLPPTNGGPAAHTALSAAHAEYERLFGHAFVISLDGIDPEEHANHVLAGIRSRLGNNVEEERNIAAAELRALARARLTALVHADA
ncbi:2-oxo-4-hydroxy-4-carboxy-5-ureidoimidazoline decarboxylase [Streptomyces sp. ICBB 8177]|uniref:2-oxo-4-hydroxy-4-carboxy-5-ureidoimidazoline decarboxylase n=1 Tax=Streptomyces sp. ICBB 8177 TaxID=563922 RepID=UPI00316ACAD9